MPGVEQATCPVCGGEFAVKDNGLLRRHKPRGRAGSGRSPCPGSHQAPGEAPAETESRPRKPARPAPADWRKAKAPKSSCVGRIRYVSEEAAKLRASMSVSPSSRPRLTEDHVDPCAECGGWHINRRPIRGGDASNDA